jgi:hypothetical protein
VTFDGATAVVGFTLVVPFKTYTANRDTFFDSATVLNKAIVITDSFRIFCWTGLTVDLGGIVHNDGSVGGMGEGLVSGVAPHTLAGGGDGGKGALGDSFAAPVAFPGQNTNGSFGGDGGKGGDDGIQIGAAGGTATRPGPDSSAPRFAPASILGQAIGAGGTQFVSGGAGGGGGNTDGGFGTHAGGGGAGGGVIAIAARNLVNNGAIHARGGDGAIGITQGAGGGGGGGGAVLLTYVALSGAGTIDAAGGAGGAGVGGAGAGTSGVAGIVVQVPIN